MVRNIVRLLSESKRRRGVWVRFSVLARAYSTLRNSRHGANIINSGKARWRSEYDAGSMRCRITVCIAKEHLSYASGTCTKLLSVGNISGV